MLEKTLQVELKNTLQDTPLVLNPVSSVLNREETPSVQNKVLACNSPEVDPLQHHTGDQNLRVSDNVYVLNIRKEPLMPTSCRKARLLLKKGRAVVVKRFPFTIRLLYTTGENKQKITCGIDSGYSNIGFSCITDKKELIRGKVELDNFTSKHLTEKRMYRRNRRNRLRYREPRFMNRRRKEGWIPPSIERRYNTHINLVNKLKQFLPVDEVIVEVGSFDIQKINDPDIKSKDYQQGNLYQYSNMRSYILSREKGKCQLCNKEYLKTDKWNLHHIIARSEGGTNKQDNISLLHNSCHDRLHKNNLSHKLKKNKQYKESIFMNIIKNRFQEDIDCNLVFGYETFNKRIELELEKSHSNDAFVIAGGSTQNRSSEYLIKQKRRNNRALQLNRKGFKPSIRRKRYKIQPHDLIWIEGKRYEAKGMFSYGRYILYGDMKKKEYFKIEKIEKYFNMGSWQFALSHKESGFLDI